MPNSIGIFSFIVLFVFLNGKLLVAQEKNEIDILNIDNGFSFLIRL